MVRVMVKSVDFVLSARRIVGRSSVSWSALHYSKSLTNCCVQRMNLKGARREWRQFAYI